MNTLNNSNNVIFSEMQSGRQTILSALNVLYRNEQITKEKLKSFVTREPTPLLTPEEYELITGDQYYKDFSDNTNN